MSDDNFGAALVGGIVALVLFTQGAAMLNGFGDLFSFVFFLIVLAGAFIVKAGHDLFGLTDAYDLFIGWCLASWAGIIFWYVLVEPVWRLLSPRRRQQPWPKI
jgi:hypothetical protein